MVIEKEISIEDSPFKDYTLADFALYMVERYGQIDGSHHKLWVLDQVARILNEASITIVEYKASNGEVWHSVEVGTSDKYEAWVASSRGEYDEENEDYEYGYDEGIAP